MSIHIDKVLAGLVSEHGVVPSLAANDRSIVICYWCFQQALADRVVQMVEGKTAMTKQKSGKINLKRPLFKWLCSLQSKW